MPLWAKRAHVLVQEHRCLLAQRIGRLLLEQHDGMSVENGAEHWFGKIAETGSLRRTPSWITLDPLVGTSVSCPIGIAKADG